MVIMWSIPFGTLGLLADCSVISFPVVLFQGSVGVRLSAHTNLQLNTFTASVPPPGTSLGNTMSLGSTYQNQALTHMTCII